VTDSPQVGRDRGWQRVLNFHQHNAEARGKLDRTTHYVDSTVVCSSSPSWASGVGRGMERSGAPGQAWVSKCISEPNSLKIADGLATLRQEREAAMPKAT